MEGEKKDFEKKISELEAQKYATNRETGELRTWVGELETWIKVANERKLDITPFRNHSYLIQRNMYQVQLKLADEIYKIQ